MKPDNFEEKEQDERLCADKKDKECSSTVSKNSSISDHKPQNPPSLPTKKDKTKSLKGKPSMQSTAALLSKNTYSIVIFTCFSV